MIKNLVPAIISEPGLPQVIRIHGHNRRCAKSASSQREIDHCLLSLQRDGQFHDLLDLIRGKDTFKSLKHSFWSRDIDPFAPGGHAKCWRSLLKFIRRIMVFEPIHNPHRLLNHQLPPKPNRQDSRQGSSQIEMRRGNLRGGGGTTFRPSISPAMFESWFPNASSASRGGVEGLPTLSRAPPTKNGSISTGTS